MTKQVSAILGIFPAGDLRFLLFCDECAQVAQILKMTIYRIEKV